METAAPKVRYLSPPVRFDTGGSGVSVGMLAVLAGLWTMGALAVLYGLPWRLDTLAMGFTALSLTACAVYWEAHPRDRVSLDWSAQGWHSLQASDAMNPAHVACVPTVVLDFQRLLLLRVQDVSGTVRWVWCQRQDVGQWHRFRCALFAARQP